MPPSSDQEILPASIIGSIAQRQAQKQSAPGGLSTKKERKNGAAKDITSNGSAVAMKQSPKNIAKPPTPPLPTIGYSKEGKVVPVSGDGTTTAYPTITSPLLGALSSNAFTNSAAQNTTEWAKNVPAFSTSPGNLISLSDSPPTVPSSYDDKSTLAGWTQRERLVSNGHFQPTSPPNYRQRPMSFHTDGNQAFDDHMSQRAPNMYRRSSMYSQHPQRYSQHPPLPHQPQPHFYGAPDLNIGLPSRPAGLRPGSQGYYCGFDILNKSVTGKSRQTENVVVSGFEGGLEIFGVSKNGLDRLAFIDTLRGGVYNAKILPWSGDAQQGFPLVAVVLHSPVYQSNDPSRGMYSDTMNGQSDSSQPRSREESVRSSPQGHPVSSLEQNPGIVTHYETTVEVYSLSNKKHVATILKVPKVLLTIPITSPTFVRPQPVGALSLSADAGNLVVTSGSTGEVWIYQQVQLEKNLSLEFRCIGKIWTTVQHSSLHDPTMSPDLGDPEQLYADGRGLSPQSKAGLISLKGRWLAYCPSSSSSQVSLRAIVPNLNTSTRVPGLHTYAPPQTPPVSCAVDTPDGEEFWGRMRRQAMQEAIKGAKWLGDQTSRAWSNYVNKSPPPSGYSNPTMWQGSPPDGHAFPPTNGPNLQHNSSNDDPVLISIIDLEKLGSPRSTLVTGSHVLATFKSPLGCSFISFAPGGLALFTASSKGDVQFVWDLMRIQHTKSSALQPPNLVNSQGQHIRQIAIFTRLTVARIVDVVWTVPHGERIAMITERNTVHFLDMPSSAFVWPPSRRRPMSPTSKVPPRGDLTDIPLSAASIATNAASAAWGFAQPFLTRPRGLSGPGRSGTIAASLTATAGHGGKVLASTISKSFGAASGTIEHLRKSGDSRLHLPQSTIVPSTSCVKWLAGNSFAALVDGTIKIYTIKQIKVRGKPEKYRIHISSRSFDLKMPYAPEHKIAPAVLRAMDFDDELDITEKDKERTDWSSKLTSAVKADVNLGTESSIPQAEIESNAPYQPFHTDRRVALFVYSKSIIQLPSPSVSALLSPQNAPNKQNQPTETDAAWVFGLPISATKLDVGGSQVDDEDFESAEDHRALPSEAMERVTTRIPEVAEDLEQIVITTRRRKGVDGHPTTTGADDEEGFFEDDMEVLDFASSRV